MKKNPPTTIFSDSAPLTDQERRQLAEELRKEWFYRTLDKLSFVALGDRELTKAFRAKAKSTKGKLSARSASALEILLMRYAMGVELFGGDRQKILDWCIEGNKQIYGGVIIDHRTMDNRISEAISKVSLNDLPEWTHDAVKKRRARYRGKKSRRK
jgi:hypothetical protein